MQQSALKKIERPKLLEKPNFEGRLLESPKELFGDLFQIKRVDNWDDLKVLGSYLHRRLGEQYMPYSYYAYLVRKDKNEIIGAIAAIEDNYTVEIHYAQAPDPSTARGILRALIQDCRTEMILQIKMLEPDNIFLDALGELGFFRRGAYYYLNI